MFARSRAHVLNSCSQNSGFWIRGEEGADASGQPYRGGGGAMQARGRRRRAPQRCQHSRRARESARHRATSMMVHQKDDDRARRNAGTTPVRWPAPSAAPGRTRRSRCSHSRRSARGGSGRSAIVAPKLRRAPRGRQRPTRPSRGDRYARGSRLPLVLPRMRADNASDAAGRRDDPARQGSVAGRLGRSCGYNRRVSANELDRRRPQSPHRSSGPRFPGSTGADRRHLTAASNGRRGTTPLHPSQVRRAPGRAGRLHPA